MMLSGTITALLRNPETPDHMLRDALQEEGWDVAKVYVVVGETDEYSDRQTWTVAAYLAEEQAETEAARLNMWCRENHVHITNRAYALRSRNRTDQKPSGDPGFQCDYTGTEYTVDAVELRVTG